MAYLIRQQAEFDEMRYELTDKPVIAGRSDAADITLKDPGISRNHFQVRRKGHVFVLTDLNSSNGTYINSHRILQARLQNGDEISVGQFMFLFDDPEVLPEQTPSGPDRARMLIAYEEGHNKQEKLKEQHWDIHVTGGEMNQMIPMMKYDYLIGSGHHCDILLEGKDIDDAHVLIIREEETIRVIHFGDTDNVYVGTERIEKKAEYKSETAVQIGKYLIKVSPAK